MAAARRASARRTRPRPRLRRGRAARERPTRCPEPRRCGWRCCARDRRRGANCRRPPPATPAPRCRTRRPRPAATRRTGPRATPAGLARSTCPLRMGHPFYVRKLHFFREDFYSSKHPAPLTGLVQVLVDHHRPIEGLEEGSPLVRVRVDVGHHQALEEAAGSIGRGHGRGLEHLPRGYGRGDPGLGPPDGPVSATTAGHHLLDRRQEVARVAELQADLGARQARVLARGQRQRDRLSRGAARQVFELLRNGANVLGNFLGDRRESATLLVLNSLRIDLSSRDIL